MRKFLHVDDLGAACLFALEKWQPCSDDLQYLNVGTGIDLTIKELAEEVATVIGFEGKIIWDHSKPNGTPKKQLDVSQMRRAGWVSSISLKHGIENAAHDFRLNNKSLRL